MRRWIAGIAAVALVGTLAGCKGSEARTASGTSLMKHADYMREYESRKKELTFPGGYPKDRREVDAIPESDTDRWEVGSGAVAAVTEWNCAWVAAYVTGSSAQRDKASEMVDAIRSTSEFRGFPDDVKKVHEDVAQAAEAGNMEPLRDFASVNCPDLIHSP